MQSMFRRSIALTLVLLIAFTMLVPFDASAQGTKKGSLTVPLALPSAQGVLTITRFQPGANGGIVAVGIVALSKVVTVPASGTTPEHLEMQTAMREVSIPVISMTPGGPGATGGVTIQQAGGCDILTLVLGPLHLDLLGLVVDLNRVVLTITGETGAGNLLGNLLCAIAGLLDGTGALPIGGALNQIINLLNQILAAL